MVIIKHPIKPEKAKAWHWKSHQYFTKQAHNVVNAYIRHFTKEGDIVLDPFCGTGVTAIEALALRRKAVMIDLNPLACFITEQTCKKVNLDKFIRSFNSIEKHAKNQIDEWCSSTDQKIQKVELSFWYPKGVLLPANSDFERVEDLYSRRQLLSYSLLYHLICKINDHDVREMMKYVFSATMSKVNLTYWTNAKRGLEGGGTSIFGAYRYHRPPHIAELDVWKNFAKRFSYILKGKKAWMRITEGFDVDKNLTVINASVLNLSKFVKAKSVDYVYADPPYGGNIAYLDLSTMWNAWLRFEVDTKMKENEIIEGGDLQKSKEHYEDLFTKSFEQIGQVLKKKKWLSVVFAHKKLEFWNTIIDGCESNGMEFKGSTYQPTNNSSVHYKKNPANVLCSQRIANFQKTFNKSPKDKPGNLQGYIINEIERTCMELKGAELDQVYQRVLDRLHNNHLAHEAKKEGYLNLNKFLDDTDLFVFDHETQRYYVKSPDERHRLFEKQYYQNKDEVKMFLKELLRKHGSMTLDEIHKELFEVFKEDKKFPIEKDLYELLNMIAFKSKKTRSWVLKDSEPLELDFDNVLGRKLIKIKNPTQSHSDTIFRLSIIGNYLGFGNWIGKREQGIEKYEGVNFKDLSVRSFPMENLTDYQKKKIEQIDVIWFDRLNIPRYAFEIEQHTAITSGFERFTELLSAERGIANKLFIVAPKSRRRKIEEVFTKSNYIGHPNYLENKVKFIFSEDVIRFYNGHLEKEFDESDLRIIQHSFNE